MHTDAVEFSSDFVGVLWCGTTWRAAVLSADVNFLRRCSCTPQRHGHHPFLQPQQTNANASRVEWWLLLSPSLWVIPWSCRVSSPLNTAISRLHCYQYVTGFFTSYIYDTWFVKFCSLCKSITRRNLNWPSLSARSTPKLIMENRTSKIDIRNLETENEIENENKFVLWKKLETQNEIEIENGTESDSRSQVSIPNLKNLKRCVRECVCTRCVCAMRCERREGQQGGDFFLNESQREIVNWKDWKPNKSNSKTQDPNLKNASKVWNRIIEIEIDI